jgi:Fe-S-cluster-containing dehydrogenase component
VEVAFALDPNVHDGRFANNAWLLEHAKPVTHLTWDNAACMSPATARRLDLATEDVALLEIDGRTVRAPVLVVPGHADEAVTLHLGWGRRGTESLARGAGFDAGALRTVHARWFAAGLSVEKIDGQGYRLARTQLHNLTEDRPIALSATLAEYRSNPAFTAEQKGDLATLYPLVYAGGEQWAMTIDMAICTGCSACVIACQAENNILVVGKSEVLNSREMHWLRIDDYYHGAPEDPRVVHQPMLCQHCEQAPCEYVCPVNATVHSPDGLNEMVYNRCVGTRFCSNNCPYKVRRFNWFDWNDRVPENRGKVELQRNPDVTVRQRGVMEKCTYCVQRIREVEIHARIEDREIRPGEVVTACQQACPTEAIQFGSLRHADTPMARWREEQRSFQVLHDLGTRPRTMYLARIDNPNPEIE